MRAAVMAFFAVILLLPQHASAGGDKAQVKQMEMFEASLEYDTAGINPYDYSKVVFKAVFKAPSSKRTEIEGFILKIIFLTASLNMKKTAAHSRQGLYPKSPASGNTAWNLR